MEKITIAIDGHSACGKSTLAKALAKSLNYDYIDSGAMYRCVALFAIRQGFFDDNLLNTQRLIHALSDIHISFAFNEELQLSETYLNGENVEEEIRTMAVSNKVSLVAVVKEVRHKLVDNQRELGKNGGIVMDGRDIGSVVFPNAELKLFMTASPEVRTERRYNEIISKGKEADRDDVMQNLLKRDEIDSNRSESPLIQANDAIKIDNSDLTQDEQLNVVLELVEEKLVQLT